MVGSLLSCALQLSSLSKQSELSKSSCPTRAGAALRDVRHLRMFAALPYRLNKIHMNMNIWTLKLNKNWPPPKLVEQDCISTTYWLIKNPFDQDNNWKKFNWPISNWTLNNCQLNKLNLTKYNYCAWVNWFIVALLNSHVPSFGGPSRQHWAVTALLQHELIIVSFTPMAWICWG